MYAILKFYQNVQRGLNFIKLVHPTTMCARFRKSGQTGASTSWWDLGILFFSEKLPKKNKKLPNVQKITFPKIFF